MVYMLISAAVFWTDFFVKTYVDKKYARKVIYPLFGDKIRLEKYYNRGAALNILEQKPEWLRRIHGAMLAVIAVRYCYKLWHRSGMFSKLGDALLLGGGFSNLYDRYARGYVVDYFHINKGPSWFRNLVFNLSDFCIFAGAFLTVAGSGCGQGKSRSERR